MYISMNMNMDKDMDMDMKIIFSSLQNIKFWLE
jgi:hypothetical protein